MERCAFISGGWETRQVQGGVKLVLVSPAVHSLPQPPAFAACPQRDQGTVKEWVQLCAKKLYSRVGGKVCRPPGFNRAVDYSLDHLSSFTGVGHSALGTGKSKAKGIPGVSYLLGAFSDIP